MQFLVTMLLVVAVHLAQNLPAWTQVGLLSDDRHMVGGAVLRHRGTWTFASMFLPERSTDAATALYRPFIDLVFWLEQPWFGASPIGYHAVNSAMHCGTALLWFVLVRRLSGSVAAALACAVLFVGWPGHSEATHWIAARTNVQSTFLVSLALVVLDLALLRGAARARGLLLGLAALLAVAAVGTKESAVFVVPLAAVLCWWRSGTSASARGRAVTTALWAAPGAVAVALWLWWRAHLLGTWGSGTHYGWHAARVTWQVCGDWAALLLAPVHASFTPAWWKPVLVILHAVLLGFALRALRARSAQGVGALGGLLVAMGYLAGIGLERMDPATLENVRYSYEPALGLCALLGLGIAVLPARARGVALGLLVLAHALVLDGNREAWLRAGRLYRRMEADICDIARATQRPIRVLQAPGVYEGAFALLNGFTEFQFMQAFAPAGTNLRGAVSSTQEWEAVLRELAAAAAAKELLANTFTVQWDDGALAPYTVDGRWPQEPWPGAQIGYAWVARTRPFVGSTVPVHVLVRSLSPFELQARARVGERTWAGPVVQRPANAGPEAIALSLPLSADLVAGAPIAVELVVRGGGAETIHALGSTWPAAR